MRRQQKNTIKLIAILISALVVFALLAISGVIAYEQSLKETLSNLHQQNSKTRAKLVHMGFKAKQFFKQMALAQNCKVKTKRQLQSVAINDPLLSIAFIKSNDKLCANVENFQLPNKLNIQNKISLQGPFTVQGLAEPGYIISQVTDGKLTGLIFTQSIFVSLIKNSLSPYLLTSLYSAPNHHTLLLKNNLLSSSLKRLTDKELLQKVLTADRHIKAVTKIALYQNLYLVNAISNRWVIKQIQHHLILLATLAILLSILVIALIARLTKTRLSLEYDLSLALRNDEFIPHYQPVIDLETDNICGVECLIRWQIDDDTLLYPDSFIKTLIDSPLIQPVTQRLIEKVFQDLGDYCQANPGFHLAINLTPTHFKDEVILNFVLALCETYQVKTNQVIFELTEQNLIDEGDENAKHIMIKMQKAGFELALDDFGTGFANINYLQRFRFNYLKIDRQFVVAIHSGAVTENIAASIVHLAHNLNLKVIAEGLDTIEHANYLKNLGVSYAQGYYYAKPVSITELRKQLTYIQ